MYMVVDLYEGYRGTLTTVLLNFQASTLGPLVSQRRRLLKLECGGCGLKDPGEARWLPTLTHVLQIGQLKVRTQRLQYPLIMECTLNYNRNPNKV